MHVADFLLRCFITCVPPVVSTLKLACTQQGCYTAARGTSLLHKVVTARSPQTGASQVQYSSRTDICYALTRN